MSCRRRVGVRTPTEGRTGVNADHFNQNQDDDYHARPFDEPQGEFIGIWRHGEPPLNVSRHTTFAGFSELLGGPIEQKSCSVK